MIAPNWTAVATRARKGRQLLWNKQLGVQKAEGVKISSLNLREQSTE